jgi:hypothetical protein
MKSIDKLDVVFTIDLDKLAIRPPGAIADHHSRGELKSPRLRGGKCGAATVLRPRATSTYIFITER